MSTALEALNRLDRDAFVRALGAVVERSPWVAERAWAARPFASLAGLHRAMQDAVRAAPAAERLALLRAHPDLAGRAARAGALTEASRTEQAGAGLDRLSDAEVAAFERLNAAYRSRFGFPFILCVRNHPRVGDILGALEQRLRHSVEDEVETALGEVAEIARHRLLAWAG